MSRNQQPSPGELGVPTGDLNELMAQRAQVVTLLMQATINAPEAGDQ